MQLHTLSSDMLNVNTMSCHGINCDYKGKGLWKKSSQLVEDSHAQLVFEGPVLGPQKDQGPDWTRLI